MPRAMLAPVSLSSLSLREGEGVRLECGETLFRCPPLSPLQITLCVMGVEPFMVPTSCNWHPWPGGMACAISARVEARGVSKCTPLIGESYRFDLESTWVSVDSATAVTLAVDTLGVAISDAVTSSPPSMTLGLHATSTVASEITTSTVPPFPHVRSGGCAAARASSSSRCFFLRNAKSFKDILTFGTGGGGGVGTLGGGDCAGGGSKSNKTSGVTGHGSGDEVRDGDSAWLLVGEDTRLRGSEEVRDCGDGERMPHGGGHGGTTESQGSSSTSICIGPRESTSGEEVEVIDKKEEVKVDNLGESGEELEE